MKLKRCVATTLGTMHTLAVCFAVSAIVCWSPSALTEEASPRSPDETWAEAWKLIQQNRSVSKPTLPTYSWWITDPEMFELTRDVVTPHVPWAKPYGGSELRLVVIAPRWTQRTTVELEQRFDFATTPVMTKFAGTWSDSNSPGYAWLPQGSEAVTTATALAALQSKQVPDVIVIGVSSCSILPERVEQAIVEAVRCGSGLVLFHCSDITPRLQALLKQRTRAAIEDVKAVVDGIPLPGLPLPGQKEPRALVDGAATFYETDNGGRIVVVDYSAFPAENRCPLINCYLSPPWSDDDERVRDIHYEYYCSFGGRCILWAGRALPKIQLVGWPKLPREAETHHAQQAQVYGALSVTSLDRLPKGLVAEYVIRDNDGTVEHRQHLSVTSSGQIALPLPTLKSGGHFADVILRNAEGRSVDWGSSYFTSRSGADIISVSTDKKSYRLNDNIPLKIELAGRLDGAQLEVELRDTLGRLLWATRTPARKQVSLDASVTGALTIQCKVNATLKQGATVLAASSHDVLVRQPALPSGRFIYCAWTGINRSFVRRRVGEIMAAEGIQSGVTSGNIDLWASLNVRPVPYLMRIIGEESEPNSRIRKPCVTDPTYLEALSKTLKEQVEEYRHYSPLAYSLGDDVGMLPPDKDWCVSPTCLKDFRKYLAAQYGTVKALNASWGTNHTTFDEAVPLTLEEAIASGNVPAWADHRLYMDHLFVRLNSYAKSVIQSVDREVGVGFEAPLGDDSWSGYLWKSLLDTVDMMVPYPNAWKFDIARSFARPGTLFGGWYGGYAMYRNSDDARSYPWFLLFNGCNSYWFFSDYSTAGGGHPSEGLAPDLRVLPCLRTATEQVHRIQEGIDRLVLGADSQTDPVAVYFSRPSVHAGTVMSPIPMSDLDRTTQYLARKDQKWPRNIEANLRLLDDLGLSYRFVDRSEIVNGGLQKGKFELLVMPFVLAMSGDEAQAIRQFVESGGAVLSDIRPGMFDAHVKPLEQGQLDEMFGVVRQGSVHGPLEEQLPDWSSAGVSVESNDPMPVDSTVRAAGGDAGVLSSDEVPLFIRNIYGKGNTLLLNMSLQHYLLTLRPTGRGQEIRDGVRNWLDEIGITPDVRVECVGKDRRPISVRAFKYKSGTTPLLGILRSHKRVPDDPDAFLDRSPRPVLIHFGTHGYIYEVINRRSYGKGDRLQLQMPVATPFLFSVLPYRVMDVNVAVRQKDRTIRCEVNVVTSEGKPDRHVLRVRVVDAKGDRRPEYENVWVAPQGHTSGAFPLALDDPEGWWDIYVEDVVTGTVGRQQVKVGE